MGRDGNGHAYTGDSMILDPLGETLFHVADRECVHVADLDRSLLEEYRLQFPAWRDADTWSLALSGVSYNFV